MNQSKSFGTSFSGKQTANRTKTANKQWRVPAFDLDTQIEMWQSGLLQLQLPKGVEPRPLTKAEKHWLDRAAAAEYIAPEENGQRAVFYTSPPPEFRLEVADWYLHPDDYWNQPPVLLREIISKFPAELFQLCASGQAPAFYPERTPAYSNEQETVMRAIFRETVRLGWALPQYKWLILERYRKTTAQVTLAEANEVLAHLQTLADAE